MKRSTSLIISTIAATILAAPAAMAGNDIVKCVDADGHVTLTDQPCAAGAATVRLEQDRAQERAAPPPAPQRQVLHAAPLRQVAWRRPDLSRPAPLTRDVATLREAHRAWMLQDARPRLAGLQ